MAIAFKITTNNQYIQPITLNAGEYTLSAWMRADDAKITITEIKLL